MEVFWHPNLDAASVNYINKMSNYCQSCVYEHQARVTPSEDDLHHSSACPFNYFYWDFIARHRDKLKSQGHMKLVLAKLEKMASEELENIHQQAEKWHHINTNCTTFDV